MPVSKRRAPPIVSARHRSGGKGPTATEGEPRGDRSGSLAGRRTTMRSMLDYLSTPEQTPLRRPSATGGETQEKRRLAPANEKAHARASFRVLVVAVGFAATAGLGRHSFAQGQQNPSTARPAPIYTIGPTDVLQVIVWREPELTRDVTVRFDGMITLPLVGDMQAAGRTPRQLADSLTDGLQRFMEAPRVSVGIAQANSARFYVVGQVTRSGEFPLTSDTRVLQGLALAGGFREFAKTDDIVIVRQDQSVLQVNYKRIADGKDVSQNVALRPGDTIVVP